MSRTIRIDLELKNFDAARVPIKSSERVSGDVPYLGASGEVDRVEGFTHEGDFLCVSEDGENLRSRNTPIAWVQRGKFWANNHVHILGGLPLARLKFYEAALAVAPISSYITGSAQPKLSQAALSSVLVPKFCPADQEAVGQVLGAFDDKIAVNRRLVSVADDSIRAHVSARLAEPSRLWGAVDFVFGEAFKGDSFSAPGTGRALVRIRDLKSQKCQVWTTERRSKELEVRPGDLLVGMDAEFRATRWSGPTGVLNQRVLAASSDKYGPAIAREMLVAPLRRIERSKSGTTVIHLNKSDLLDEGVLIPVDSEVSALRALVDPMWDRAVAAEQESVRLAATRDELLPLLMSGKITVKDAEKTVEEVV